MFPGTTIANYLFWMVMGLLQALVAAGTYEWLKSFNRSVAWWQAGLIYGCFVSLCTVVCGGFTLMGEYESQAGWYFIGFLGLPHIIAMALLMKFFVLKKTARQER